ncbi:tRNA lysidine(34) synthetase TilS [Paludifilum halophilum]|nr:tRNA lysidine(34) synthetase TilS [Paludifilum halophilum]
MLDRVRHSIEKYSLLPRGVTVLTGVSGGPDSMALLHALWKLAPEQDWRVVAIHVNHLLRGKESEEDERYVRSRCREWGIPCQVERVDVTARVREKGGNRQAVARDLRYEAFRRAVMSYRAKHLALAHQADDQVETILMRLIRGAAPMSMAGIPRSRSWRGIRIVRPLLDVFREEVESYCDEHRLSPRLDQSNRSRRYTRNRVRLDLIPQLLQYNPRAKEALLQFTRIAEDEESFWKEVVGETAVKVILSRSEEEIVLDAEALTALDIALQRRLIKLILNCLVENETTEANLHAVEQVRRLAGQSDPSARVNLPGGAGAEREYRLLRVFRTFPDPPDPVRISPGSYPLAVPGETGDFPFSGCFRARIESRPIPPEEFNGRYAVFDADVLRFPLHIRSRQPGDRLQPKGLGGTKKVKDILIDAKVPRRLREELPLVLSGEEIVWIPGVVRSEAALVTKDTRRFLYLEWKADSPKESVFPIPPPSQSGEP